ncbi:MAG: hypothetical protein GYA18_00955 [Chloroflexi bacterium]|nr:hypothetical protein [Chloroflexota bacterium]
MLKVVLFAPIRTSLYSRLILHGLLHDEQVQVVGIVVRTPWNMQRIRSEFSRDGVRLAQKFVRKFLLREKAFNNVKVDNLANAARRAALPDAHLQQLAKQFAIPFRSVKDLSEEKCTEFLKEITPDIIVFTGGGLVRQAVLDIPKLGVLNCHTGVLPPFRGMDVVEWTAMVNAVNNIGFGVTLHYMDKGVDTGEILLVKKIETDVSDTFISIRMRLEVLMVNTMLEGVHAIADNLICSSPQNTQDGKQYFVMHPRIKCIAEQRLEKQLSRN